jgi:hypothetical protein
MLRAGYEGEYLDLRLRKLYETKRSYIMNSVMCILRHVLFGWQNKIKLGGGVTASVV